MIQHYYSILEDSAFSQVLAAVSWSLHKLMSIELVMPSNHLILCCPLLLPLSIFLSIKVFSNESALCIRWPGYWNFSFSISASNEYSGLISFRTDWCDLLAIQGTLTSLFQHHSLKASIIWSSAFSLSSSHIRTLLLERIPMQCGRHGFNPWVRKIPWRRERLPTPLFWSREFYEPYSW